jgi:hypothetical protein
LIFSTIKAYDRPAPPAQDEPVEQITSSQKSVTKQIGSGITR